MKKAINILMLAAANLAFAQIAIGKASISNIPTTSNPNPSVSLEFGDFSGVPQEGKGIVLPWVDSAAQTANAVSGTIIYDVNDKIIKYKVPTSTDTTGWKALSKNETTTVGANTNFNTTGAVNTSLQNSLTDGPNAKASIGTPATPDVPGILVLESSTQAMILPKVPSPHLNVIRPEAGTMVYDTVSRQLAVFNGTVWSFWKP
ncbi:hypothetical protein [Chryseobacterium caseinilyticum]|uniref:Uncharacterized protein n=1 Tax=Chryseobacterium caseinilyticum TaxID=2771428 RepID=A0ABR8ZEY4_9FLAO|nr:hypothetical protein [Chryseobacterium caseinilyticum]MBD8083858.1 hypothetical protein [Chryseobacterium caseinilyticum]